MQRPNWCRRVAATATWALVGFSAVALIAQPRAPIAAKRDLAAEGRLDDETALDGVFLPPDRTAKRRLETSQGMIGEGRFGEAVRLLGSLLENNEDFFFKPSPDQPVYRSLKAEAGRLIAELPAAGRESYELQFGARARTQLKQAVDEGRLADLAEVSRQFFYTHAGQEATYLLGRHHLDQGRPQAAALCFERLREMGPASQRLEPALSVSLATCWLRAGKPDKAKAALVRLKRNNPTAEVLAGGAARKLFAQDADALAWMDATFGPQRSVAAGHNGDWALYRGDEGRNAESDGGQPLLNVRWRQRTADDRMVEKFVSKVRHDYANQEIVALPSLHPLVVGDTVLMRTAFALQAVDFRTGKLIWKYSSNDESLEQFLKVGSTPQPGQSAQLFSGLDQRIWEDAVYGTLASDGQQVYYVDDLGLGPSGSPLTTVLPNGRRVHVSSRNTNHLAARELRTQGKLKWEVGGPNGDDEPKLAGAFFLGPPLPVLGRLYALAEIKGQEIRIVSLSPETGALDWSQQLAVVEQPVAQDSYRRNAGASPSYADGILVCPTSAGAVVAIDLTTRALLWGYQYPRFQQSAPDRFNAVKFGLYPGSERRVNEHWVDGSITMAEGCALVTPVESDQIYCLDAKSGKELWKQNRDDNLYVACVHDSRVILIGRESVSALNLADGEEAWPPVELPSGSLPSGRGFQTGDHYYLPLTSAEVVRINLQNGQIDQRARSREGNIPGNLVCHGDTILSHGVEFLDAYYQLDALRKQIAESLQTNADDPRAMAALAEVKLSEGALAEAVELLRRSYSLSQDEISRGRLVEALLDGLRKDFATHRGSVTELDGLIQSREHRLMYLRLVALGRQAAGETMPAFETYLKLAGEAELDTVDPIDDALSVRRDRWIQAQLDQLRSKAEGDAQVKMDAAVATRLDAALAADSTDALRRFLSVFGSGPSAATAAGALVSRLGSDNVLECENWFRKLDSMGAAPQAMAAAARLAALLEKGDRPELAAIYYRQLADRFAQVAGPHGKTGAQLAAALPDDSPVRRWLSQEKPWPTGKVSVKESQVAARTPAQRGPRSVELDLVGPTGPIFADMTVSLDLQTQVLVGKDGYGEKRFRVPIYEHRSRPVAMSRFNGYSPPPLSSVSVNGGLLILSMSNQVMAVDATRGVDQATNRILWTQELSDQVGGFQTGQGIYARPIPVAWGAARYVPEDTVGRRYGTMGPVTNDGLCFQRLRDLHCVDPLSGKTLWTRKNVGLGNQLFGDEELLFVAPAGDEPTLVLRAATGELLGERRVPPFESRMAMLGRQLLVWNSDGPQQTMRLVDPWDQRVVWEHSFANGSKADLISQDAVGVLEPDGKFSLVTLPDGKLLVHEQLEPEKGLVNIHLLRTGSQYLLITHTAPRPEPAAGVQLVPNALSFPLVNGRVYSFDRASGKKSWPAPAVVSQYGLMSNQPSRLPLLVFVRQIQKSGGAGGGREQHASVLCIDKRTGAIAYQSDQLPPIAVANFELTGDPARQTVTLSLPPKVIELTLTDEPAGSPPPAEAPATGEPPADAPAK